MLFRSGKSAQLSRDVMTRIHGSEVSNTPLPGKASKLQLHKTVPQTDTGGQDENSKVLERTLEKELGKLTP